MDFLESHNASILYVDNWTPQLLDCDCSDITGHTVGFLGALAVGL